MGRSGDIRVLGSLFRHIGRCLLDEGLEGIDQNGKCGRGLEVYFSQDRLASKDRILRLIIDKKCVNWP